MVPLGWVAGGIGLVAATALSLYASCLVAMLHEFGGRRHLRYRDLAGHVYGRTAYYLTWALQYANLFIFNTGFIILAADALKAAYFLLWDNHAMKLPYFTAVAGVVCALFAVSIPHLSGLRIWLGFSTIFSLVYITTVVMLSLQDGIKSAPRDYSMSGSNTSKIFRTVGATANLFFVFNTGMLPEIQATVRQPVVSNTLKALFFQFTFGAVPMYAVTFVGYWAFGASSSSYLLTSVSGPVWLKIVANITAFLQSVISLHMFASPVYEYMDTKYGIKGSYSWFKMATFRIGVRGGYIVVNTFVAALLPFLGDFMSLGGAISTFPLTFVLGNHMYITALGHNMTNTQRFWHWLNIGFFSFLSYGAAIAAVRLIAADSKTYSLFADL